MSGIEFIYDVNQYFKIPKKHVPKLMTRKLRNLYIRCGILLITLSIFLCFKWYSAKGVLAAIYFYLIVFLIIFAIRTFPIKAWECKRWSNTLYLLGFLKGEKHRGQIKRS